MVLAAGPFEPRSITQRSGARRPARYRSSKGSIRTGPLKIPRCPVLAARTASADLSALSFWIMDASAEGGTAATTEPCFLNGLTLTEMK